MPADRRRSAAAVRSRPLGAVEDAHRPERTRTRARTALLVERDSMTARASFDFDFHHSVLAAAAMVAAE